jgi:dipeptidyl aminopeptidase/acylaminoacyl peptidase
MNRYVPILTRRASEENSRSTTRRVQPSLALRVSMVAALWLVGFSSVHAQSVSFRQDVAPILVKRCLACHGEQKFKGEFQLHSFETLMKAGESGDVPIAAGKPGESHLYQLIVESDAALRMPKDTDKLADAEIDLIRRWIAEGAKFDGAEAADSIVNAVVWKHPDPVEAYPRPFPITSLAFRPDGKEVAVGGHHEITIWNADDGALVRRIKGVAERTYCLTYNQDGSLLAVASGTPAQLGEVKLFNPIDGNLVRHLASMTDCAFGVAFSADGQRLAASGADHKVRVFDVASGKQQLQLADHSDWVMNVAFSPDGSKLASASRDKTCKVFDSQTGSLLFTYADHGASVYAVAFNEDGGQAISCGADNRVHFWHSADQGFEDADMKKRKRQQIATASGFGGEVFAMTVRAGNVFACSADKSARQFDAAKRNQVRQFSGHNEWLYTIAFNEPTRRLAAAGLDGQVRIWNIDAKDESNLNVATFIAAPGYQY